MNLALFYSFAIHFLLFCILMLSLASNPIKQKDRAMYTIDFIGNNTEVLRYGEQQEQAGQQTKQKETKAQEEIKQEQQKQETKTEIKA